MPTKRKRGRPALPKGSARTARLICRMLESDMRELETAAEAAEQSLSDWVRETLLATARKTNYTKGQPT